MPLNNYSVGRDVTLNITTDAGTLSPTQITKFSAKQDTTSVKVKRINGVTDHIVFPDGWSGGFDIERADSTLDDFTAANEAGYYAGLDQQSATITQIIAEPNGTITEYEFQGVMFTLASAGEWAGDSTVKQSFTWVASRRIKRA